MKRKMKSARVAPIPAWKQAAIEAVAAQKAEMINARRDYKPVKLTKPVRPLILNYYLA